MHNPSVRETAISLRIKGFSYSYISDKIGVSKSTLSDWLSVVPYQPNTQTIARVGKAIAMANAHKTLQKKESIETLRKEAEKEIGNVSKRDLFMFGLGLYLGEGAKTHDITRVTNSDSDVICIAIAWFYSLGITRKQLRITLHLYPDSDTEKSLHFWSRTTTIPRSQFGKVQVDTRKNKKSSNSGKLPYGTAHLSVRSLGKKEFGVALARKIKGWTDTVANKI